MKNYKLHCLSFLFVGLSSLFSFDAVACVRTPDSDIAIVGSYQAGTQSTRGRSTEFNLPGCKPFNGQFLVLVNAPIYTDPQFKSISSPEGELPEERCYIDKSPFTVSRPQDVHIDEFYQLQTKMLNSCLEAEVTDVRGEIDTTSQINCEINKVAPNKVIARGPRCAFKIFEASEFKVNYRLNPLCLKKSFLQETGELRPMDIKASLGIYKTTDLTPGSPDYDILTLTTARITLQPDRKLIPVSTYGGTVGSEWPMQYGAQVEMGKITLNKTPRLHSTPYVFLRTPFLVNNNCPEKCNDGLCASPCEFYAPVAARMSLKKKAFNETNFHGIDYWYQGSIVPPKYVGELALGRAINESEINVGDRYLLTAEFSSPALTYQTIVNEARQLLIKLIPVSIPTRGVGRPGGLQGLEGLGANIVPNLGDLPVLGNIVDGTSLEPLLASLNAYVAGDDSWPPYYSHVINGDESDNANHVFQTLKIGFRVANISPYGMIALDHLVYMKDSKIFGSYEKPVTIPPQIKCTP